MRPLSDLAGFDPRKLGKWNTVQGLKEVFEKAGFRDVSVEEVEVAIPMEKPEMFVHGFLKSSNPGAKMAVKNLSEEELDRVCVEWVRLIVEMGNKVSGSLIVAIGRK